ncbi:MAG: hypothetical protein OEQ28_12780, partial [Acidobacteriota bacterium]|nr:hypothetical protein [Acidobacteriota bacterium]
SYLKERAAVWEWLAYVKLRGVTGEHGLAEKAEHAARGTIHAAAEKFDRDKLRTESHEMRLRLQAKRSGTRKGNEVNIKYGEGGLQDVYFAIRYLQLRDNIPDDDQNRSTLNSLSKLRDRGSLSTADYLSLKHGYTFLRLLDHNLRLNSGRSNRVVADDPESVRVVAERMGFESPADLLAELTSHRLNIRDAFDSVFESRV